MSIISDNNTKSPELQASILEPILLCCLYSVSFNSILLTIQKILQVSFYDLKNYLFYMVEYGVVSYDGQRQAYRIEKGGLDLLNLLKKERNQRKVSIKDITITFEYAPSRK